MRPSVLKGERRGVSPPVFYSLTRCWRIAFSILWDRGRTWLLRPGGGRLPLAEVATEVDFADQGHFTGPFKRLIGVTPRRFL